MGEGVGRVVRLHIGFGGRADPPDGLDTRIMGEGSRLGLEWRCGFLQPWEGLRSEPLVLPAHVAP